MLPRSMTGAALILVIVLCRALFARRMPRRVFVFLWTAAAVTLLWPGELPSPVSLWALVPHAAQQSASPDAPVRSALSAGVQAVRALLLALFGVCYAAALLRMRGGRDGSADARVRGWLAQHPLVRTLRVRVHPLIRTPRCVGILRPVILLSEDAARASDGELDCILMHEYLHICRFDPLRKLLFAACACVFWYSPAVWLMAALAGRDLEYACDEAVLAYGYSPREYGAALLRQEVRRAERAMLFSAFSESAAQSRVQSVLRHRPHGACACAASVLAAAAILLLFAAPPAVQGVSPELAQAPAQTTVSAPGRTGAPQAAPMQPILRAAPGELRQEDPYGDYVLLERRSDVPLSMVRDVVAQLTEAYRPRFVRVTEVGMQKHEIAVYQAPER